MTQFGSRILIFVYYYQLVRALSISLVSGCGQVDAVGQDGVAHRLRESTFGLGGINETFLGIGLDPTILDNLDCLGLDVCHLAIVELRDGVGLCINSGTR